MELPHRHAGLQEQIHHLPSAYNEEYIQRAGKPIWSSGLSDPFHNPCKYACAGSWNHQNLLNEWQAWELELQNLQKDIHFPCCFLLPCTNAATSESHSKHDHTHVSFSMARSRIATKRQPSIPHLELCAALSGAQLANLLNSELTFPLQSVTLWTGSTMVLSWLTSDSCRYKMFVVAIIVEIQTLTDTRGWKYVDSKNDLGDDLTWGKTLLDSTCDSWIRACRGTQKIQIL